MRIASNMKLKSIAFPNISTGAYGFPKKLAAEIAIGTVREFLAEHQDIDKVVFSVFDEENHRIYRGLLDSLWRQRYQGLCFSGTGCLPAKALHLPRYTALQHRAD